MQMMYFNIITNSNDVIQSVPLGRSVEFAPRRPRIDSTWECLNFNRYTCAPHFQTAINLSFILPAREPFHNPTNSITFSLEILSDTGTSIVHFLRHHFIIIVIYFIRVPTIQSRSIITIGSNGHINMYNKSELFP